MITLADAHAQWLECHRPMVVAQFGADDIPALAESWAEFTDSLTRDGELTGLQYHYAPAHDDDMPEDDVAFILTSLGMGMVITRLATRPYNLSDWGAGARHWGFTITRGDEYSGFYTQGSALTGIPTLLDVLSCVLSDAQYAEYEFDDFCDDMGYDTDSRRAERVHGACKQAAAGVARLLTSSEREDLTTMIQELI